MGGGDDPHFDLDALSSPNSFERAALEDAEQFGLKARGDVADFVEQQRTSMGELKSADLAPFCTGESPFLVPEQLALQERIVQYGAVERHKRPGAPRICCVQRLRNQLFAGPGFTVNQDRRANRSDLLDQLKQLGELWAL